MRKFYIFAFLLLTFHFSGCPGPDYMPEYFPSKEPATEEAPATNVADEGGAAPTGSCTVNLSAQLCVIIYGEKIQVGTEGDDPLCTDVEAIPIEVSGANLILRGNAFPDIPFEGHGLPAPITINAKGTTDGSENIGKGKIDSDGNILIEGFSLYINALGMIGELPDLSFTTGKVEDLEGIDPAEGSPLASDGKVKLLVGTILGHLFPAADEKLFGASLLAAFDGTIDPPLNKCSGGGDAKPQATYVTKIVVDESGHQTEGMLPASNRMEVGEAYISRGPKDIGPNYESSAMFKIVNATSKAISIDIPPMVGVFSIEAQQGSSLKQELPPKTPLVITVTFRPAIEKIPETGEVNEAISVGPDVYQLIGSAVMASGKSFLDVIDEAGNATAAQDRVELGSVTVSTMGRREFFMCKKITCDGAEKLTACVPCVDVLMNVCQLVQVDKKGEPIGTVDASCKPVNATGKDEFSIGLGGDESLAAKQVISIKNTGVTPLTVTSVEVKDPETSKSKGQFKVAAGVALPVTIKPYDVAKETIQITVIYEPNDLVGFDGGVASVGHPAKDKAVLRVVAEDSSSSVELTGITVVKEVPAVQVYFKSATGTKELLDGSKFAFRGLTSETQDLAVPVFIKLSDSATNAVRVTKMEVSGPSFEWLDTKEKVKNCAIPVFDANGGQTGTISDLDPVSLLPNGFDLKPGAFTTDNMPLFGCANFHMPAEKKRQFEGTLTITMLEIGKNGDPVRNPDGSMKQTDMKIGLLAVINPLKGPVVFRLTQTMSAIMNPQIPSISAASSVDEMNLQIKDGVAVDADRFVMPGALILDPFDEDSIKDEQGNVLSTPGDGVTLVYRKIDTHPVSVEYDDPLLPDWTSLVSDMSAPEGSRGIFFDYPNVPEGTKNGSLRIFTASLSYPGPLASPEERPESLSLCQQVDPCSEEGQKMHGTGPTDKSKLGVCAFFYGSAGTWNSPAMHYSSEMEGGERKDLCKTVDKPQKLNDITGHYDLNGDVTVSDFALRLWGPTYINNPKGPIGPTPPLDAVLHLAPTTGVLKPAGKEGEPDVLPDKRINPAKQEHKINLNDTKLETARLCDNAVKNRILHGEYYSTWKYLAPLLTKDEEGLVPAGCPEPGNELTGGSAFLHGRPLDQETGILTFVAAAKFESDDNLTFAFKDVMFFLVFNGWLCDPLGSEEEFEGARCFDNTFNERDGKSTISMMK